MSTVSPETRHRNLVTFVLLVLFAFGLCALVFWSMRVHARRVEEAARTSPAATLWRQGELRSFCSVILSGASPRAQSKDLGTGTRVSSDRRMAQARALPPSVRRGTKAGVVPTRRSFDFAQDDRT